MNIEQAINTLNFYIGKETGSYYTPQECIDVLDIGQLAYFSDIKPKYATSQLIKDILAPFKRKYNFTPTNTISGYIVIPSDSEYLDLLDVQIQYQISNRTIYFPVPMVNEDERANQLNSQVDPVTITSPLGEMGIPRYIQLYPTAGYTGTATYLKRPVKPVFAYNVISGRNKVYDPINSVQLEWRDTDIPQIIIKALRSIGINLSDSEVQNFAQVSSQQNYGGVNHQ